MGPGTPASERPARGGLRLPDRRVALRRQATTGGVRRQGATGTGLALLARPLTLDLIRLLAERGARLLWKVGDGALLLRRRYRLLDVLSSGRSLFFAGHACSSMGSFPSACPAASSRRKRWTAR